MNRYKTAIVMLTAGLAVFSAVADAVEESAVSSMMHAEKVTGFMGHTLEALVK